MAGGGGGGGVCALEITNFAASRCAEINSECPRAVFSVPTYRIVYYHVGWLVKHTASHWYFIEDNGELEYSGAVAIVRKRLPMQQQVP